jgi:xanthine dehydrogenase molybdenum-binding subunit
MGLVISTCGHKECLETVAGRLNWRDKRKGGRKTARGVGMASLFHVGGSGRVYRSDGSGVILKLDDFGNVTVYIGGVEMGQGLLSAVTLATADALGVTPDKVTVIHGDTAVCPWDVGTHASRGAFTACNAVIEAARKAKEKIFQIASTHFMPRVGFTLEKRQRRDPDFVIPDRDYQATVDPEDFELQDNVVFLKWAPVDPILRVPLDELIREAHFKEQGTMIVTDAFYDPCNEMLDARVCRGNISATYIFGVQGAEVEVDVETGQVRILRIAAAHDVGKVLNQQTLRGQFYGGIIQGVGYALTEEIKTAEGKIQNPDFTDYKILSPADVDFPIDVDFIETDDMEGPFGAKGVGEPGLVPTAPAVANAVYDAVGVRIRDLPVTPEKVLAALREKAKKENR